MPFAQPLPSVLASINKGEFLSGLWRRLCVRLPRFERKPAEPAEALLNFVLVQARGTDQREFGGFTSYTTHLHTLARNPEGNNWQMKVQGDTTGVRSDQNLVAGLAVGGLKLVLLGVSLGGVLAFRSRAIQIGARTIVERGLQVHPNLYLRIAHILWSGRRLGQP